MDWVILWSLVGCAGGTEWLSLCPSLLPERKKLLQGWTACRPSNPNSPFDCVNNPHFQVSSLPTTALIVLLDNQAIAFDHERNITSETLYVSTNLKHIPDIQEVGRDYYTLLYQYQFNLTDDFDSELCQQSHLPWRHTIRFSGINYRATAFASTMKGIRPIHEIHSTNLDGMFRRRSYNLSSEKSNTTNTTTSLSMFKFSILVQPPLHPGSAVDGGQGGDHSLAMDGATAQYMLGWDWCQAMPDRSTGFFGAIWLERTGPVAIIDPTVETIEVDCDVGLTTDACASVKIRFHVRLECLGSLCERSDEHPGEASTPVMMTLDILSDWGESWELPIPIHQKGYIDFTSDVLLVEHPTYVKLWWPHGLGLPAAQLHTFTFRAKIRGHVSDEKVMQAGFRTVTTYLDATLQGQVFQINGKRIYIVGGNWIGTDQALRFSASEVRYCNELKLHRHAGINLIRVWGGGTAETDEFYNCADRLGLMVFQEFWMTGDNNGRWAGNYSWPLDHDAYLANVQDSIRRLRRHPSLLFYGGCNECLVPRDSPGFPGPPKDIDDGIRMSIQQYDPLRFYISSSMGGRNKADKFQDPTLWSNRTYSLAYGDGPYGMELAQTFFEKNPGIASKDVNIGFQPEIGSTSSPTYEGLLRFLSADESEQFPQVNGSNVGEAWMFHRHLPWFTNGTFDHVQSYLGPNKITNASEWCAAAQLAAHSQYQSLFGGFISHIFEYTTAVIMWKTQSPWPALRGFLYDWYLETTGGLRGTRAALGSQVSIVYDPLLRQLRIVNRKVVPVHVLKVDGASAGAQYAWINIAGQTVCEGTQLISHDVLPAMSSFLIDDPNESFIEWPKNCSSVCFLRMYSIGLDTVDDIYVSWLWLTDPLLGHYPDYSALGEMRQRQSSVPSLEIESCTLDSSSGLIVKLSVELPSNATEVLFYPTFSVYVNDSPLLPLFDRHETNLVILPGHVERRILESQSSFSPASWIMITMRSWNAPTISREVKCPPSTVTLSTADE